MKSYLSTLFIIFFGLTSFSQEKNPVDIVADNGLMARQIPGTEEQCRDFFSSLDTTADTIYALIFRPANCPRCDGTIPKTYSYLKSCTRDPFILISVCPDTIAARKYNERLQLKADGYIYDPSDDHKQFLSFNYGTLHIGYIMKVNRKTGEIITIVNNANITPEFFTHLSAYTKRQPPKAFQQRAETILESKNQICKTLKPDTIRILGMTPPEIIRSEIIYNPLFYGNHLFWNDKLDMSVLHYKVNGSNMTFERNIRSNANENSRFIEIPDTLYHSMATSGELKYIPLQPFMFDNKRLAVPYSLPNLVIVDSTSNSVGYFNKPCFIVRSLDDYAYADIIPLNYDFSSQYFFPHFTMKSVGNDKVAVGVERMTWPIIDDRREYEGNPESDPFMDEFYDHIQPTMALYSIEDGLQRELFGRLPDFARKARTGYTYSGGPIDCFEDEITYANSSDGKIFVTNLQDIECGECAITYNAFEINTSLVTEPDSTMLYSYQCADAMAPLITRLIVDIKSDDKSIHCLIRHPSDKNERPDIEKYSYTIVTKAKGEASEYDFPDIGPNERRISYGLRRLIDGNVEPFTISEKNNEWKVTTYDIN